MMKNRKLNIFTPQDSISVDKSNGTHTNYFLFPEYEIHYNQISPHTVQEWHYHQYIEEVLVIISGEITCRWYDEHGQIISFNAHKNDIIQVGNAIHTIENTTNTIAEFIVFRLILDGNNKQSQLKSDKVIVDPPNTLI